MSDLRCFGCAGRQAENDEQQRDGRLKVEQLTLETSRLKEEVRHREEDARRQHTTVRPPTLTLGGT